MAPVVLAGDFNVVPTDADIYPTRSYAKNALVQPEPRALFRRLLDQGWVDAIRTMYPDASMYTFWDYKRNRWQRDVGLRLDHLVLCRDDCREQFLQLQIKAVASPGFEPTHRHRKSAASPPISHSPTDQGSAGIS